MFPVTDKPGCVKTQQNNVEAFNVKWTTAKGRLNGNGAPTLAAAQAMAERAQANGATDIKIERTWIAGYAF